MSTIVVVKKDGQTVIGADTLTKYGEQKEPASLVCGYSKILEVGSSYLAFVGHASFGLVLESYLSKLDSSPSMNSKIDVFEMVRAMHPVLKKEYFLVPGDEDSFEGSDVDCLIANSSGIYGVYGMQNVHQYNNYYSFGSGSQYAIGAMHGLYNRNISAKEIAEFGLNAATTFDDASEGPLEFRSL